MRNSSDTTPEAYLIGSIPFVHADIDLSLRPLIPRVETEYWVSEVIKQHNRTKPPPLPRGGARQGGGVRILDAFAGSGCIGVAILKDIPNAHVDFLEKDPKLKKQIAINLRRNGISKSRAKIIIANFPAEMPDKKYDYIFANPPYIDPAKKHTVQKSVLEHEPHEALFAKDHGLYFIKQLIALAPKLLLPRGKMYVEFGQGQKREIERYVQALGERDKLAWDFSRDQYSRWRVLEISVE